MAVFRINRGMEKTGLIWSSGIFFLLVANFQFVDCQPSFTGSPNNGNPVYQIQGNDVILSWFYNPDGKTVDEIEWSFNSNQRIATKNSSGVSIAPAYTNRVEVSGSATIKLKNIQAKDSGNYDCRVTFTTVDWIINQAELIVVVGPQITLRTSGPAITIDEGNTRTLLCVATGNPKPLITWYRGSTKVQQDPNNSNYTITSATRNHAGTYRCEAVVTAPGLIVNPAEHTFAVTVRFKPQHRVDSLQSKRTVVEGQNAELYCRLEALPTCITYRWFKDGSQIFDSGDYTINTISDGQRLTANQVKKSSAGQYSCEGQNALGVGERKSAYLLVNYPPAITYFPQSRYTVNETNNVTMVCRANGVPTPEIIWRKSGSNTQLASGEEFSIVHTSGSDDGTYTCTAKNDLGQDSREITLSVQTRPTIVTSTPIKTQIPGAEGEKVYLPCIASGKPSPSLSWKRQLNGKDLSSINDDNVNGISVGKDTSVMKVTVSAAGEKFYCVAVNLLGRDNQEYTIRERGLPDAPIDVKLVAFKVEGAKTVSVNVSWTPGYSGGYDQAFTVHYRLKGSGKISVYVGHPDNNMHTMQGLLPNKTYGFTVQASNQASKSQASALKQVKTPESSVHPDRGTGEKCEKKCEGKQSCRQVGETFVCVCKQGKKGRYCEEIDVLRKTFDIGIEFNMEYKKEYGDLENAETKKIVKRIEDAVMKEYKGSGISRAKVTRLRKGSVVADMVLTFSRFLGESEVAALLSKAASDDKIGEVPVSRVVTGEFIKPKDESEECEAFFEGGDCKKAKPAMIAVLGVVGGVAVLVVIVAVIAYSIRWKNFHQGSSNEQNTNKKESIISYSSFTFKAIIR
ncbi:protein turtle homolog B-like isoform X3 [Oculina patagonica]